LNGGIDFRDTEKPVLNRPEQNYFVNSKTFWTAMILGTGIGARFTEFCIVILSKIEQFIKTNNRHSFFENNYHMVTVKSFLL
jgi:hypothetical protein